MKTLYYLVGSRPVMLEQYEHYETVKAMDWITGKFSERPEFIDIIRQTGNTIVREVSKEMFEAHVKAFFEDENGNPVLRVTEDDLMLAGFDGGGGPVWHYKMEPFTGTLVCFENDGTTLAYEQGCEDGYEDGWHRAYHPNGQIGEEYKQQHNRLVSGTYKKWDENGDLLNSW